MSRLRSLLPATMALLAIGLAGCSLPHQPPLPSELPLDPTLEIAEVSYNFGSVEPGTIVQHTFLIGNRGQQPLEIESVKGSCGCTAALATPRTVEAGQQSAIEVTLDTSKLSGARARSVTVRTNDPLRPEFLLTLEGAVATDVTASPAEVYLGRVRHGTTVSRAIDVTVGEEIAITGVSSESGRLKVKTTPLAPPERGMHVLVTLPGTTEPGRFNDRVLVATTSTRQPLVAIPVLASIESELAAWPPHLQLGSVTPGAIAGETSLRNRGDHPIEIAAVRTPSPALIASVETEQPGWKYRVRLKVREDAQRSDIDGTIDVLATGKDTPITVVPVSGRVRGS